MVEAVQSVTLKPKEVRVFSGVADLEVISGEVRVYNTILDKKS